MSTRRLGHPHLLLGALLASMLCLVGLLAITTSARADEPSKYGIESVHASLSTTQAGAHPDFAQGVALKTDPVSTAAFAGTRNVKVDLPPGLVGNPAAFPACPVAQFVGSATDPNPACPVDTQVGIANINLWLGGGFSITLPEPLYLLPGNEETPARLGFIAVVTPVFIDFKLRSDGDYGLSATARGATDLFVVNSIETITWGVPADSSHDELRMTPREAMFCQYACEAANGHSRPSGLGPSPFMTNPTNCEPGQSVDFTLTSYALPGQEFKASAPLPQITGCDKLPFAPKLGLSPTTTAAESPSGMDADLQIPQDGLLHENTLASAHLKKAVVTLPKGFGLNPAGANGLAGCSESEIGVTSEDPLHFNTSPAGCPDSSKIGTAKIVTPLLGDPIDGSLYLANQNANPFHSLAAVYLYAKSQGVTIKQAGRLDLDPQTGQITATFDDNPQQPFSDLQLHFKGGSRAPLTTPSACGTYTIQIELTSWGGQVKTTSSTFQIDHGPNGGPCPAGAFAPKLTAGTDDPVAGHSSPFVLRITREDGMQNISAINATLPEGVLAKLAGVPVCSASEASAGACPADSKVGSVRVGAGSGSTPVFVPQAGGSPTAVYLGGPYKGGPYSLVVEVPAQAGPFDLGTVTVRNALYVDPVTTQVTTKSDLLPQILQGVPISYRDIRINIDRPDFTVNPTSCERTAVQAEIASIGGKVATPSSPFQVGDCGALGFKPKLAIQFSGAPTHRGGHPALKAVLTMPKGDANIGRAQVTLPKTEFLENAHIRTICTRVQYAADNCPKESIYGFAKAWSPLLDTPLEGPVYLRSSSHTLPDLVASLDGQIHVDLDGRISSANRRIRNTFDFVPDAPVSKFVLKMQGGQKGLLVNNTELCKTKPRAKADFTGQNGRRSVTNPLVKVACGKK